MNQNKNKNGIEGFLDYNDVKTKTINWCDKMQKVGLLTADQYDQCIASFADIKSGILPADIDIPSTGLPRNYSLYNTRSKKITANISGEDTNTVMFVTNTGLYMACRPDNSIYFISDINESTVNQNDINFTLIPQNSDVYTIMSPYGKYLICNTNWGADFSGTTIGTMSSWNVSKIDDKTYFESVGYSNYYLAFDTHDQIINIEYGKNDNKEWLIVPQKQTDVNNSYSLYNGSEYIVLKADILQKMKTYSMKLASLNVVVTALTTLKTNVNTNFTKIEEYMKKTLNYNQQLYIASKEYYDAQVNSIKQNMDITIDPGLRIVNNIPPPTGANISNDDITNILNKITNVKAYYIGLITSNIGETQIAINNLILPITDYDKFISDLNTELNSVKSRVDQNNIIMGRQQSNYDTINQDYNYITNKQSKLKTFDNKLNLNLTNLSNYKTQTGYLVTLYPIIIIALFLFLMYLGYITIQKITENF
jgi:hypothetical protein